MYTYRMEVVMTNAQATVGKRVKLETFMGTKVTGTIVELTDKYNLKENEVRSTDQRSDRWVLVQYDNGKKDHHIAGMLDEVN